MTCFYSVAPHSKSIKRPTDLFKFDWEKDEQRESREAFLERNKEVLKNVQEYIKRTRND